MLACRSLSLPEAERVDKPRYENPHFLKKKKKNENTRNQMAKKALFYYNFSSYNAKWIVPRGELQKGDVCSQPTPHSWLGKKNPNKSE